MVDPEVGPVEDKIRRAMEICRQRVADLPKGKKGAAYRQCIREALGGL